MAMKRYSAEQIIGKLRAAEILLAKGQTVGQVSRALGVTEQTYYRWRKEYGASRFPRPHSSLGYRPPAPETISPQNTVGCLPGLLRKEELIRV